MGTECWHGYERGVRTAGSIWNPAVLEGELGLESPGEGVSARWEEAVSCCAFNVDR